MLKPMSRREIVACLERCRNYGNGSPKSRMIFLACAANDILRLITTIDQKDQEIQLLNSDAAKAVGRLGGLRGGPARADRLTSKRRSEIARMGGRARWKQKEETPTGKDQQTS